MAGRVTQESVEVFQTVDARQARVSQEAVEVFQTITGRQARVSQLVVEVFVPNVTARPRSFVVFVG